MGQREELAFHGVVGGRKGVEPDELVVGVCALVGGSLVIADLLALPERNGFAKFSIYKKHILFFADFPELEVHQNLKLLDVIFEMLPAKETGKTTTLAFALDARGAGIHADQNHDALLMEDGQRGLVLYHLLASAEVRQLTKMRVGSNLHSQMSKFIF